MKNVLGVLILLAIFLPSWFVLAIVFDARGSVPGVVVESPNIGRAIGSFIAAYLSVCAAARIVKSASKKVLFWSLTILILPLFVLSIAVLLINRSEVEDLWLLVCMDILVAFAVIAGGRLAGKERM